MVVAKLQDAAQCLHSLVEARIKNVSWLVVDHYGLDTIWEKELLSGLDSKVRPKLLVIDDLADRPHQADFLLDQNFHGAATHQRYQNLFLLTAVNYWGLTTHCLDQNILSSIPLYLLALDFDVCWCSLVGLIHNLTSQTLEALLRPDLANLYVDVVLGLQSPHRKTVQELVDQRPNTTLHGTLPSLAGLIARADLSIGAGGASTWERACLGLPSLVVAVASNQLSFSVALDQAGHCQLLGDAANVTVDHIYAAILARMNNPLLDQSPYALTDGWGAQRLCIAMLGIQGKLAFRIAKEFDEALLWRLSSGIGAGPNRSLKNSSHDDNQHFSVKKKFADSSRRIFIAETADGCPIGQIHIYKHPLGNTASTTGSKIDYLLDKCAGDAGLESELVTYSFRALEQCWNLPLEWPAKCFRIT